MSTAYVRREDEIGYLCERAIRELKKELRRRLKNGELKGSIFPVSGSAESAYGQVLVAMEWKPLVAARPIQSELTRLEGDS